MKARAPGKVVLSGAYAVLDGAPALVAAVDRYVIADCARPASFLCEEVRHAIAQGTLERAPWFDASALRADQRKLGLGSSAAIVAASIGACRPSAAEDGLLAQEVFPLALKAHRAAQPGGSGIDVAAACFGGVLRCQRVDETLEVGPHALAPGLSIEIWGCLKAASTAGMVKAVKALERADARVYRRLMGQLHEAAESALEATLPGQYVAAMAQQQQALTKLGEVAGVPIVTSSLLTLAAQAEAEGACMLPSGAGGGDVALYCGSDASPPRFRERAAKLGMFLLEAQVGASGLCRVS